MVDVRSYGDIAASFESWNSSEHADDFCILKGVRLRISGQKCKLTMMKDLQQLRLLTYLRGFDILRGVHHPSVRRSPTDLRLHVQYRVFLRQAPKAEEATTKSLRRSRRRVAHPRAIARLHLHVSFGLNKALASETPMF